jgi:hypothetical protein
MSHDHSLIHSNLFSAKWYALVGNRLTCISRSLLQILAGRQWTSTGHDICFLVFPGLIKPQKLICFGVESKFQGWYTLVRAMPCMRDPLTRHARALARKWTGSIFAARCRIRPRGRDRIGSISSFRHRITIILPGRHQQVFHVQDNWTGRAFFPCLACTSTRDLLRFYVRQNLSRCWHDRAGPNSKHTCMCGR